MADTKELESSITEIWDAAEDKFRSLTGKSLKNGPTKDFKDVQLEIESRSKSPDGDGAPPTEDKWDKEKFKNAGLKVLKCLKVLVGAATQLSNMLPIPSGPVANMCANALLMVLDIPQAIRGLHDAISDVFDRLSSVLSQFRIYERLERVDTELARRIHLVMTSFVTICAHVVNYKQGGHWERFKHKAKKAIADDDSGLKAEMSRFEKLVQQQRDVEGTVVLETVMNSRKDIGQVLEQVSESGQRTEDIQGKVTRLDKDATETREEKDRTKKLSKIRDTLSVYPHVHLDTNTTETCTNIYNKRINAMGSWVFDHPSYREWTLEAKNGGSPLLLLSGDPASGKTSIAAMVTKSLEDQKQRRIYVAHFFFPPSSKKSDDEKYPVQSALRYMAFQLARVDTRVLNVLYKACESLDRPNYFRSLTDLGELWNALKVGSSGLGATYHLVFDGVEHLKDKHAESLVNFALGLQRAPDAAGSRVRVLLSGTEGVFKDHQDVYSALRIDVSKNTVPDMEIFINNKLNERGILQSTKQGSKQDEAKKLILQELPQSVKGSYSLLHYSLDNIVRRLDSGAGLEELQEILKTSMSSHEAAIQSLQRSLGLEEIRDLNEMLKWVVFGADTLNLNELEAAMFLYSGKESLATLKYIIKNKYLSVLKLENDLVMVQEDVKDILQKGKDSRHKVSSSREGPTISMSITINNVDQELCQHFLWDLAQKSIRDKFKFDFDSAANRLVGSPHTIEVDEFEANHSIVKHALDYLEHNPLEETRPIGSYLATWLPHHLKQLHRLEQDEKGELSPVEKRHIADGLYSLFKSDEVFKRHKDSFAGNWSFWYPREMRHVHEWFMDSAAVRRLDKQWLREIKAASSPTRGYLRPLVRLVLDQLLQERDRTWDIISAYRWLEQFVLLDTTQPDEKDDDSSVSGDVVSRFDLDWWKQVGEWCRDYLGLQDDQLDSFWYERLGEAATAMDVFGDTSEAILEFYHRAVSFPDASWRSYKGLGEEEFRQGKVEEAIAHVEKALERAKASEDSTPVVATQEMVMLHLRLGDYCYDMGALDKAIDWYDKAQSSCGTDDTVLALKAYASRLRTQLRAHDAPAARQLLRESLADDENKAKFVSFLKELARDDSHNGIVAKMFTVAKSDMALFGDIVGALEVATATSGSATQPEDSPKSNERFADDETRAVLLFDRGLAAYHYKVVATAGAEPNVEAVKLWKDCYEQLDGIGGERASATRESASTALAKYYFESMTDGNHLDSLEDLEKLVHTETHPAMSRPTGFLGALHARRGDKERARKPLSRDMKAGLQVLSDNIEENDEYGFFLLHDVLVRAHDFGNATVALSLFGAPDLVTECCLSVETDQSTKDIAQGVSKYAKSRFPEASQQWERVQAAAEHVREILNDSTAGLNEHSKKVYADIQEKLESLLGSDSQPSGGGGGGGIDFNLADSYSCAGSKEDGGRCGQKWDSEHDMYKCRYCADLPFCARCWRRLVGNPEAQEAGGAGVDILHCSPKHKWIKMPPRGSDMYRGPKATSVRIPTVVRPAKKLDGSGEDDDRLTEVCFDETNEEISLQEWKERLATEWGFSLDEITKEVQRADSPESSEDEQGHHSVTMYKLSTAEAGLILASR